MSIFKSCDIRGVVGSEWGEPEAEQIGVSLGQMLQRRKETCICLGGDYRRSTAGLKNAFARALTSAGIQVVDLGQLPTPVAYFGARHLGIANVAIVTASHNAGRYNGLKFMVAGQPAVPELMAELQDGLQTSPRTPRRGNIQSADVVPAYMGRVIEQATQWLDSAHEPSAQSDNDTERNSSSKDRRLRVVLDAMGGAFTHIAPRVLRSAGFQVERLTEQLDQNFTERVPNPAQDANLASLVEGMRRSAADLGVGLDGDGDRVVFVDHSGRILKPEQIAAVLIEHGSPKPIVVYDLKCASIVPRVTRVAGGEPIMRPSGHGFIKTTMIERNAELGVEVSGHHFFRALHGGDDGLFTALVILSILQRTERSLAELVNRYPWPLITPDLRWHFEGDAQAVVERIAANCRDRGSRLDGIRVEFDQGWGLARASITEPAVTFRFEGRDPGSLLEVADRMLAGVDEARGPVLEMIHEWAARSTDWATLRKKC